MKKQEKWQTAPFQGSKGGRHKNSQGFVIIRARMFEISKFFKFVKAEFNPRKHLLVEAILSKLSQEGIRIKPVQTLYIDYRTLHLRQIKRKVGPLRFLQMWVDAKSPNSILENL